MIQQGMGVVLRWGIDDIEGTVLYRLEMLRNSPWWIVEVDFSDCPLGEECSHRGEVHDIQELRMREEELQLLPAKPSSRWLRGSPLRSIGNC